MVEGGMFPYFFRSFIKRGNYYVVNRSIKRNLSVIRKENKTLIDQSEHRLIYDYKHIKFHTVLVRFKKTYFISTLIFSPVFLYLEPSAKLSLCILFGGAINYGLFHIYSKICNNLIGFVFAPKSDGVKEVIFSYVNIFGKRIDKKHNVNDICNLGFETKFHEIFGINSIHVKDSDVKYKICVGKGANVHNSALFKVIVGNS